MDTSTYESISELAGLLAEYEGYGDELRSIAKYTAEPMHKRRLEEIARLLDREIPDRFFNGGKLTAFNVLRVLSGEKHYSDEEVGAKIGRSASTVRQCINALSNGGIQFDESHAKGFRLKNRKGYGKRRILVKLD
ncbi:MAG TPA: hypothetical protein VIQ31_04420 [Phormidium sp.]